MDTIKITLHSFVDIITNSSTEIYTNPVDKAVDSMYEILGNILKVGGIETDPKELFDVYYETQCPNVLVDEDADLYDDVPTRRPTEEEAQAIKAQLDYENNMDAIRLVVNDKTGKYGDIMNSIWRLFHQEASYNG